MAIVTSYDWESDAWTQHHNEAPERAAFRAAVADIATKAKETLPDCAGRVDAAVKIVLAGDVELLPDDAAKVASQSNGTTKYFIVNGGCTCPDYAKAPSNWCKHRIAFGIQKRTAALVKQKLAPQTRAHTGQAGATQPPAPAAAPIEAPQGEQPSVPESLKPYVVYLHGKPFIRYVGLLTLTHERGLVQLTARIEYHSEALVLASATATFSDGRVFTEWADAMPDNVGFQVRPHWVRMALTRAKARCLRDALQIGIAALEELADE
jgi:hypothetical protein